ncbi:MAG: hypothetical protein JWR61_4843 [Ferruginibacter sp.]|uniref:glycosylase n=1 Tax=Ferruginibacter sp. TaxID=1940288 RepID=UPI002657E35D|nr:glycosylase [Ferruginibacter sp.]MDB5279888.1 hypothetical protein [Ferruginibacter sp.]
MKHQQRCPRLTILFLLIFSFVRAQNNNIQIREEVMQKVYNEVKTPYKYGLVMVPPDDGKKLDCPTIFKKEKSWYMTYIVYDGRGYETWLAKSSNVLRWKTLGKILSFADTPGWDANQKAGYNALQDMHWGGNYQLQQYDNKYWMSYLGGNTTGYEAGRLSIGMAWTDKDPAVAHEWQRTGSPVLKSTDADARWYDNGTLFKSSVIWDVSKKTGHPFVMYYNARGDSTNPGKAAERISMAVSDNMVDWKRYGTSPVIDHHAGISGDAVIQKIDDCYVMFYFGAFWNERKKYAAFNRFACSYDLINWTDWTGEDLVKPSEPYDETYAHKSFVIKYKGIVYHFYCAVNSKEQRGIAVATSEDKGKSNITFSK